MKRIEELLGAKTGEVVSVVPRYVLITNGFGHEITELASHVKNPDKALVVYDHNLPAGLPEESKIFQEILQYARKEKIPFYQAKGIAQKWMLEENMVAPTDIIITGTRHSSIFGSIGALGLGLSHTEMARVLETGEYQTVVPETVTVRVIGKLRRGVGIIDVALHFLDAAGAKRYQNVKITLPDFEKTPFDKQSQTSFVETVKETLSKLSVASQKGLIERFDSSIGNGTVLSPFGGIKYHTETEGMAALIPVLGKETTTASVMTYGYNPLISKWSPYHGAMYAIVESVAKIVAMGGNYHTIRFSFQEYFEKLLDNPITWGKPTAALLGAYRVQSALKLASIGGKDSMSGSFEDLHVPPTLVSFAITSGDVNDIMTPEIKETGHVLAEIIINKDQYHIFDFNHLQKQYDAIMELMKDKKIYSAYTVKDGGVIEAVSKMAFGNGVGVAFNNENSLESYIVRDYGNIIIEVKSEKDLSIFDNYRIVGTTNDSELLSYGGETISLDEAYAINKAPLEKVYPTREKAPTSKIKVAACKTRADLKPKVTVETPLVVIPV